MPMMALVNPVYDCLFRLAQPDSLKKEEEVSELGPGNGEESRSNTGAERRRPIAAGWGKGASIPFT